LEGIQIKSAEERHGRRFLVGNATSSGSIHILHFTCSLDRAHPGRQLTAFGHGYRNYSWAVLLPASNKHFLS
jgi:hypothetical protein